MRNDDLIFGEFITLPALARKLNKHVATIWRWADQPDGLPYTRLGRVRVTTEQWVAEWMARRKTQKNPSRKRNAA